MDCQEVKDLLDAYALGAMEQVEMEDLERHMADCLRCWEQLDEAQRTAALLSLAVAIEEAPVSLRDRILAQAAQDVRRERRLGSLQQAFKRWWPAAAGALAVTGVAALAFAAVLQMEMNDLRDENSRLTRQVQGVDASLGQQRQMMAVLAAPDVRQLLVPATSSGSEALGVYYWSETSRKGLLVCHHLPALKADEVYQVWLLIDRETVPAGAFECWDDVGQLLMDLSTLKHPPEAIGVSIERARGSDRPTGEMLLWGSLATK